MQFRNGRATVRQVRNCRRGDPIGRVILERAKMRVAFVAGAAAVAIALTGCHAGPRATATSDSVAQSAVESLGPDGCVQNFDPAADYFPNKATFTHATGVTVEYHGSWKKVTVKEPLSGAEPATYVLVQCGATPELPSEVANATKVTIPVHKAVASSTTQLPAFEMLGVTDSLVGTPASSLIYSETIKGLIAEGKAGGELLTAEGKINVEKVAGVEPDLFMASGTPDAELDKLRELSIPVVGNAEWLETSPLGRAEWIKFTALLTNTEATAEERFKKIADDYEAVKAKVASAEKKPKAVTGSPYQGQWLRPGGKSYLAGFLQDAGMDYIFAGDEETGSVPVPIETVLEAAADTDLWLNQDSFGATASISAISDSDARLLEIGGAVKKQVYNPTARTSGIANDYWEQGVVRPDLVLQDMAKAAHPDLFADKEFYFYKKLPD